MSIKNPVETLKAIREYIAKIPQIHYKHDYCDMVPDGTQAKVEAWIDLYGAYIEESEVEKEEITVRGRILEHNIPDDIGVDVTEDIYYHARADLKANTDETNFTLELDHAKEEDIEPSRVFGFNDD